MIADATYTQFDETQANACIDNRNILFQLWDLATTYPCIASKIEIRIRQADPREDYAYDESMSDAAIVVTLRWLNTENACNFFRCNGSYPKDGKSVPCHPMTEPRVYPSGDFTTMTACEPACFFAQNLKSIVESGGGGIPPSHSEMSSALYSSNAHSVMSVRDGKYRKDGGDSEDDDDVVTVDAAAATTAPNLSVFEYHRQTNSCELANRGMIEFITQPMKRDGDGTTCRLANFAIGEDLVRGVKIDGSSMLPPGNIDDDNVYSKDVITTTGRVSRSYCDAFDKLFDPITRTCVVPEWETGLSYTFLGQTMIRLARHAVHGGDRCDEILPASRSRAETSSKDEDVRLLSRRAWFNDVDRSWVCPPPNVLLSDLNVRSRGVVWTNRNGGTVERAVPSDYAATTAANITAYNDETSSPPPPQPPPSSSSSMSDTDLRNTARRALLQRRLSRRRRRRDIGHDSLNNAGDDSDDGGSGGDDPPFVGRIESDSGGGSDDRSRRRKRDATAVAQLLNFDDIYDHLSITDKNRSRGSDILLHTIDALNTDVGILSMQIKIQEWATRLVKSAYNRALRFVGQRLGGAASRTLIALSVRVSTARMISAALTGLSTRMMLTLSTAATGVGTIVAVIELLSFALDMAIIFGWDPGNYKSETGNDAFDRFAVAWERTRVRERVPRLDPYYVLLLYSATYSSSSSPAAVAVQNDHIVEDESTETATAAAAQTSDRCCRFDIRSVDDAPWFFAPFPEAIRAMIADLSPTTTTTNAAPNVRIRPIFADSPVICNLLWTIHYFSHRRSNSNGQRVRGVGEGGDVVTIDDDVIRDAVRSNELAAFLNQSTLASSVPRARLVGAARRNFAAKSMRLLDHIVAIAGLIVGATVAGGAFQLFGPRLPFATAWLLVVALSFVVLPLTLVPTIFEMIAAPDGGAAAALPGRRAYDRSHETNDRDNLDRICDEMVNVLSSAVEADRAFSRVAATHFLPELRVLAQASSR